MAKINREWPWPNNVGVLGTFADEIKQLQRLEKDPNAAPMPAAAPIEFLTPSRSSEHLRLGVPDPFEIAAGEPYVAVPAYVVFRRLLSSRMRRGWMVFDEAVRTEDLGEVPANRREQMRAKLGRERAMLDVLAKYNAMAEVVYSRLLGEAHG